MLKAVHSLFAFHKHNIGVVPVSNVSKAVKSVFHVVNKLALEMLRDVGSCRLSVRRNDANLKLLYDMLFQILFS